MIIRIALGVREKAVEIRLDDKKLISRQRAIVRDACVVMFAFWLVIFQIFGNFAVALTEPLTSLELATIESQRNQAEAVSKTLKAKIECFEMKEKYYEGERSKLTTAVGEQTLDVEKQAGAVTVASEEINGFSQQVAESQKGVDEAQSRIRKLEGSVSNLNAQIKICKKKYWLFGGFFKACDLAAEIAGINGDIRQRQADARVVGIKLASRRTRLYEAGERLQQARLSHTRARLYLVNNRSLLEASQAELSSIKRAVSNLRTAKFGYEGKRTKLDSAYKNFKALDVNSQRRFGITQLRNASGEMTEALQKAEGAVNDNGLLLTAGTRICAD